MSWRVELVTPRELRAAAVVLVAAVALAAAAFAYGRPVPRPAPHHQPTTVVAKYFLDQRQGWEVLDGQHNHVYVTSDGGRTWAPDGGLPDGIVVSLVFDSSQTGMAVVREDGSYGRLHQLATQDGGGHWTAVGAAHTPPPG